MRKKVGSKFLLFISLFILPMVVFASDNSADFILGLPEALFIEAFVSIHMSVFVLMPLAKILSTDYKNFFWKLFAIRVGLLLFFDFFITPDIALFDFFAVFVGTFVIVPIVYAVKGGKPEFTNSTSSAISVQSVQQTNQTMLKCSKCGKDLVQGNKWCPACRTQLTTTISTNSSSTKKIVTLSASTGIPFNKSEYAPILFFSDKIFTLLLIDKMLKENSTIGRVRVSEVETKKTILTLIYLIIVFILAVIYFLYHISDFLVFLFVGITILYGILLQKYGLKNYLFKQVQSRPDEKVQYVVSSILSSNVSSSVISPSFGRGAMLLGVFLILGLLFWEPHLIFEKVENGYDVRYYTIGIFRYDTGVSIPSSYKGEDVVGIREGAFKNLEFLEYVEIPNTVTEIRDNTFKNCSSLKSIEIPEGVKRIGGSAFQNSHLLRNVVIPKTVTEIGSSAFRNTGINRVCISSDTYVNEKAFQETYANIVYYENGCVDNYEYDSEYDNGYVDKNGYNNGYDNGYVSKYSGQ